MPSPPVTDLIVRSAAADTIPLWLLTESAFPKWLETQPAATARWLETTAFHGERHRLAIVPASTGAPAGAVLGLGKLLDMKEVGLWHTAGLSDKLPAGDYVLATELPRSAATQAVLGFAYGHYRFDHYRRSAAPARTARLVAPPNCDLAYVERALEALSLARDLINMPASDLGPLELAAAATALARRHDGECRVIEGDDLLTQNFPAIHAVGRASARAPRLIDLRWGSETDPRVTLVGKGVCFDSGGLDLKTSQSMLLMKKDMGGAACVLALASMVMSARLPVRLRALVPAVENSVSANSYRPGDVLATRKGLSVEVGNTDAEGRLVLCDALAEADSERPALLVDLATLTGAARVALGPELPALFGNDDEWVRSLVEAGRGICDPLWPLPLWQSYEEDLGSKIADLNNVSVSPYAGAILGALFLRRFVSEHTPWMHVDLFAWNVKERFGRPVGAEAQCVRALYALLAERFGTR